MEVDLSIVSPDELIGKVWKCSFCHQAHEIDRGGIEHGGKGHWFKLSLEDLFQEQLMLQDFVRRENKMWGVV